MNSLDKKFKKSSLPIKKNELLISSNNNSNSVHLKKPISTSSSIVVKTNLGVKNEEISIGNNMNEESKKSSVFKRETSQSNSSNRILNNFKKENNILKLNKYVKNNININLSQFTINKKRESEKHRFASSNSNTSINLITSNKTNI